MDELIIVIGVSGSGKSTIARMLAQELGLSYFDADDYHPRSNVEKMASGKALTDEDRAGWLRILSENLKIWEEEGGAVLACSALKEKYRHLLARQVKKINWVYLKGSFELIKRRLDGREGHFMGSKLLKTQFEALEEPEYGITIDISNSPEEIIGQIKIDLMEKTTDTNVKGKSVFGIYGLGVMGKSLSLNVAEKGFPLSVYNKTLDGEQEIVSEFISENSSFTCMNGYTDLKDFVESLERPRRIFLMVKAGPVVDLVLEELMPFLNNGDIVIDGGNSHFSDTERRIESCLASGVSFIGAGVSGGEEGARRGPSIMPGGDPKAYEEIADVLEAIAAKDDSGRSCCAYIGHGGAGHFIKMVHNGIEYVEMQLLAEMYAMLRREHSNEEIADLFEAWNGVSLRSYLLGITVEILRKKENGAYLLDKVLDRAGNKGTGSWSSISALEQGTVNNMMSEAVFARYVSSFKEARVRMSAVVPGSDQFVRIDIKALEKAYSFARLINHQQGFALMRSASDDRGWDLDFNSVTRVWSAGCIIKSALMAELQESFKDNNSLIEVPHFLEALTEGESSVTQVLGMGLKKRIPLPCFTASYNYWVSMTTAELPANLIQAQRDYFGAHTYQRVDDPNGPPQHSSWAESQ